MFKKKSTIFILFMTFLATVAWIGFGIYHKSVTSTISPVDSSIMEPIDPTFDTDTINKLKSRKKIKPAYEVEKIATNTAETNVASNEAIMPPVSQESEKP